MTLMPDEGTYEVGNLETDGHVHTFIVGTHVLDQEVDLVGSEPSLIPGEYPRSTNSAMSVGARAPHSHSVFASTVVDKLLYCAAADGPNFAHTHTQFRKVS